MRERVFQIGDIKIIIARVSFSTILFGSQRVVGWQRRIANVTDVYRLSIKKMFVKKKKKHEHVYEYHIIYKVLGYLRANVPGWNPIATYTQFCVSILWETQTSFPRTTVT